jgi:thiol-disulfide isomerase/thioredoxin
LQPKICGKCKVERSTSDFDKNKKASDGLASWCKPCRRAWTNEYIKLPHVKERLDKYERERAKDPRVKAMRVRDTQKSRDRYKSEDIKGFKMSQMLNGARRRAKLGGYDFNITEDDLPSYRETECCPILGIRLCWENKGKLQDSSPTIDRIDSSRGYTPDNVVLISHRANTLKNNGTAEEHRLIADFMLRVSAK